MDMIRASRHYRNMGWDWITPMATAITGIAGVFFTWLTATQGRHHLERLTREEQRRAADENVVRERRDAYLAALKIARIDLQRLTYTTNGDDAFLEELDRQWPVADRVQMSIEARIAVEAFGSAPARELVDRWAGAIRNDALDEMREIYEGMLRTVRTELLDRPRAACARVSSDRTARRSDAAETSLPST
jgi:hypothetical protein